MPHEFVTPDLLLRAYCSGVFPMAEDRTDSGLFWLDPDERGIIPLDRFRISRSLQRTIKQAPFRVSIDTAFSDVVAACASPARGRESTWISERIQSLYLDLHRKGFAHSVECWDNDRLVGGLYGVAINGAFFGESMFHKATNASKIALTYLVARLKKGGYTLLDTQFVTEHLKQFGAIEILKDEYHQHLNEALATSGDFYKLDIDTDPQRVLQLITQTS